MRYVPVPADEACQGRVLSGATGVTDSRRSLRSFADQLSETAQVTDAGRLTCAGAAGEPELAPLRRCPLGFRHPLRDSVVDMVQGPEMDDREPTLAGEVAGCVYGE